MLTTYNLVEREIKFFSTLWEGSDPQTPGRWDYVILDEGHKVRIDTHYHIDPKYEDGYFPSDECSHRKASNHAFRYPHSESSSRDVEYYGLGE